MKEVELQEPIYYNNGFRLAPKFKIQRLQKAGSRFYFTNRRKVKYFLSVTNFIKHTMAYSEFEFLEKWKIQNAATFERDVVLAAHYGTVMHDILMEYALKQKITKDYISSFFDVYMDRNWVSKEHKQSWMTKIEMDLIAWAEFLEEYDVNLIALEYPIIGNRSFQLGGRIDIIADIREEVKGYFGEVYKRASGDKKAGDPKLSKGYERRKCIIDLKSGRKGFYSTSEVQLHIYKKLWNMHFDKVFNVEHLYNWRPKDWRAKDTSKYHVKNQTDSKYTALIPHYYRIAKLRGVLQPSGGFKTSNETISMENPISEQYDILNATDYIKNAGRA